MKRVRQVEKSRNNRMPTGVIPEYRDQDGDRRTAEHHEQPAPELLEFLVTLSRFRPR
jgi:hypothetical protein